MKADFRAAALTYWHGSVSPTFSSLVCKKLTGTFPYRKAKFRVLDCR